MKTGGFLGFAGTLFKAVLLLMFLYACMFTFSQTSVCPPDFKILTDVAFEAAVKKAAGIKQYFPKPVPPPAQAAQES